MTARAWAWFAVAAVITVCTTPSIAAGAPSPVGATTRVSVGLGGAIAGGASFPPELSADGRYVAFVSRASNLVLGDTNGVEDVFVRDRVTGTNTRVSLTPDGAQFGENSALGSISGNGRFVAFYSDQVYVWDRVSGSTSLVSVGRNGVRANDESSATAISADGRYVAFASSARNLVASDTNGTGRLRP